MYVKNVITGVLYEKYSNIQRSKVTKLALKSNLERVSASCILLVSLDNACYNTT